MYPFQRRINRWLRKPAVPTVRFERTSPFVAIPDYSRSGDAALDLKAAYTCVVYPGKATIIRTEINVAIPDGHVGLLCSRSGLATKGIFVLNAPGVIDANYRGELCVILSNVTDSPFFVQSGDRIAQLMVMALPKIEAKEAYIDFAETNRGDSGLGSSGR